MDKIYNISKSEPVNFKKFFDDYVGELKKTEFPKTDKDVQRLIGLEGQNQEYERIKSSTSLELLDSPDDVRISPYVPGISEFKRKAKKHSLVASDVKLNSVQKLIKEKEARYNSPFIKSRDSFKQVYTPTNPEDHNLEPYSDIVVSIRFYRPKTDNPLKRRTYPTFSEEFKCLGSNCLSELRDKISCVCGKKRFFELSENPKIENPDKVSDPGFFFIENTFYNDMRNPSNADYSEVIRNWSTKAKGFQKVRFQTRRMEETRFIDLEVSLGFPQLYQHHGNCEHLFTFSYVELLSQHTCLVRELYPILQSVNAYNAKFCHMCGKREYVYVVKNSKRQLHDPAYLCSVCFISFHYVNGKKVDEFKAYRLVSYNEKLDNHESFIVEHLEDFDEIDEETREEDQDEVLEEVSEEPRPLKIKREI